MSIKGGVKPNQSHQSQQSITSIKVDHGQPRFQRAMPTNIGQKIKMEMSNPRTASNNGIQHYNGTQDRTAFKNTMAPNSSFPTLDTYEDGGVGSVEIPPCPLNQRRVQPRVPVARALTSEKGNVRTTGKPSRRPTEPHNTHPLNCRVNCVKL